MSSGFALMATAGTANAADNGQRKFFVCKFVGTPGEDERLQKGQNPISVAAPAIAKALGKANPQPGDEFNDRQGRSVVLIEDTGQPKPPASACRQVGPGPNGPGPGPDGPGPNEPGPNGPGTDVPVGGVAAGLGGTADGSTGASVPIIGLMGALVLGGGAVAYRRRRRASA